MEDEEKNDPQLKLNELELGKPVKIKIETPKAIATGESKYGGWSLWLVNVENMKVIDKNTKQVIDGYTGRATLFPSRKLEAKLLEITGGVRINAEIELTPTPKKNIKGKLFTEYVINKLSEGEMPSDSIPYSYTKYMGDYALYTKNKIIEESKEKFVTFGQQNPYELDANKLILYWEVYLKKFKTK